MFEKSVSYTTRVAREDEVNGKEFCFVSEDDFEIERKEGNFIEYACYNDKYYGTNKKHVEGIMEKGKVIFFGFTNNRYAFWK